MNRTKHPEDPPRPNDDGNGTADEQDAEDLEQSAS